MENVHVCIKTHKTELGVKCFKTSENTKIFVKKVIISHVLFAIGQTKSRCDHN